MVMERRAEFAAAYHGADHACTVTDQSAMLARVAPLEIVCPMLALPAIVATRGVHVAVGQHQPFALLVVATAHGAAVSAAGSHLPACSQLHGISAVKHERAVAINYMHVRGGIDVIFVKLQRPPPPPPPTNKK